jgi:transcription elongation factor SPT6
MLALEIAADPVLRDFMRRVYLTDAVITVSPTAKGRSVIKSSHKYYPFKYMTSKSVMDFKDGQFLEIVAAENEGLVTISAKVDMEDELLEDMKKNIKNDYYNVNANLWNAERELIAVHVARGILFDHTVKWLKETLRQSAIEYVSNMCKIKLEQVRF